MTSRFFRAGDESDSESDASLSSVEEVQDNNKRMGGGFSRYLASSSDDDDHKRVVRSTKDKQMDSLRAQVKNLRSNMKAADWIAIQADFVALNKVLDKARRHVGVPNFYVRAICDLEDQMTAAATDKAAKKQMNALQARALNSMVNKVKRNNKTHESLIAQYREDPEGFDSADEDEDEDEDDEDWGDDDDDDDFDGDKPSGSRWAKGGDDDDDEDDDYWDNSDDEDSDSDSEDDSPENRAKRWLKKDDKKDEPAKKKDETRKRTGEAKTKAVASKADEDKPKQEEEITDELIEKKLKEIVAMRGRRGTTLDEQFKALDKYYEHTESPNLRCRMKLHRISIYFDFNALSHDMRPSHWKAALSHIGGVLDMLKEHKDLFPLVAVKIESDGFQEAGGRRKKKKGAKDLVVKNETEAADSITAPGVLFSVVCDNLLTFIERLDDEFIKTLRNSDHHSSAYVNWLALEPSLLALTERLDAFFAEHDLSKSRSRVVSRRIEHAYWRKPAASEEEQTKDAQAMHEMVTFVYKHGEERAKTRAMLCHVYALALFDRFYEARDMLLMSRLQDTITQADIPTQILYNRTMAQVGICAFRAGMIFEANCCLNELCSSGRIKELLAQGITSNRFVEKSPEQERAEQGRQIPYHMHINLELLESVQFVSAMLLEVPQIAQHGFEARRKTYVSKAFRRLLEFSDRQVFSGPPETVREHVAAASTAMFRGDWAKAAGFVTALKSWALLPDPEATKQMMTEKVKEETLRTYLFGNSSMYQSVSLDTLSSMFDVPREKVHTLVSKMMISEELHASWDQPSGCLIVHRKELSTLQTLSAQLAVKLGVLVENNERIFDFKTGAPSAPHTGYRPMGGQFRGGSGSGGRGGGRGGRRY